MGMYGALLIMRCMPERIMCKINKRGQLSSSLNASLKQVVTLRDTEQVIINLRGQDKNPSVAQHI